jgi:hypothetical protein
VRLAVRLQPSVISPVHGYFHDTDLLVGSRRRALRAGLVVIGRRRAPTDLDSLAAELRERASLLPWDAVARGGNAEPPE